MGAAPTSRRQCGEAVHWGKRIAIGLLLLPIAEVVAFVLVAWAIGFLPALALMVLTSVAGGLVLRHAGRGQIARFRVAMRDSEIPELDAHAGGLMMALGGILLLLPGFVTDLMGAGLLVAPVRRWLGATLGRALARRKPQTGPGAVIDLKPTEWRPVPDRELPKPGRVLE
jgi:UPF0716 protein FxsA